MIECVRSKVLISKRLEKLCDITSTCNSRIQDDFKDINPMVGINQKMREFDMPADAVTIDCLKSGKRILLILHDHHPDIIEYQFSFKDKDPDDKFEKIAFDELTVDKLYGWITSYFRATTN